MLQNSWATQMILDYINNIGLQKNLLGYVRKRDVASSLWTCSEDWGDKKKYKNVGGQRQRDTQTNRHIQTDRYTHTHTQTNTDRLTCTDTEKQNKSGRHRPTERQTHTNRHIQTDRQADLALHLQWPDTWRSSIRLAEPFSNTWRHPVNKKHAISQ